MNGIKMCAQALFHPLDCADLTKRDRDRIPWITMIILWALTAVCRVAEVYLTAYTVNENLPEESNLFLLLALIFVPLFSWVVGAYSTTTLMGGESKFTESLTGASYTLVPYIVSTPVLIMLSHVLSTDSVGLFKVLQAVVIAWVILLNFAFFMRLNDYSFKKGLAVAFIGIVAALLIWAVILLMVVFVYQTFLFFKEVILELQNQSLF